MFNNRDAYLTYLDVTSVESYVEKELTAGRRKSAVRWVWPTLLNGREILIVVFWTGNHRENLILKPWSIQGHSPMA